MRNIVHIIRRGGSRTAPTKRLTLIIVGARYIVPLPAFLVVFLLLAACAPAQVPPSLRFTPGPAVVIAGNTLLADTYSLRFPHDWRIVTGQADLPQTATFVSPDNCSIIQVSVSPIDPIVSRDCGDLEFQTTTQDIPLDTFTLTVAGSAPAEQWEAFLTQFERLIASVETQ